MPAEMEMQQALEERMKTLLEFASQTKVAAALGVTRTTVHRWAHGAAVTPGAVTRVQALLRPDLGTTKEAAPSAEGAAEMLLRLWTGPEPPPWAAGQAAEIMELIRTDREQTVEQTIHAALDRAEAEVRGSPPRGSGARGSSGRSPSNTARQAGRRR